MKQPKLNWNSKEHTPARGEMRAIEVTSPMSNEINSIILEYRQLNSRGSRGAFANFWLRKMAANMERTWQPFYELMAIVKEDGLYAKEVHMDGKTFATFEEFWRDITTKTLEEWAELESTYKYIHDIRPDLIEKLGYTDARARRAQEHAESLLGKIINAGPGPRTLEERSNSDNITINSTGKGTAAAYLTARIARDRPDILARMKAGEFPSVRAAALEAGIVEPTFSCPTDPVKAARRIRRHFTGDRLHRLIEELSK